MKIDNRALNAYSRTSSLTGVSAAKPVRPSAGQESQEAGRPSTDAAQVSISKEARELAGAQGASSSEKVQALKSKVDQGTFEVDSRMVAERMIDQLA
jgi:flagellar biosynthesis anti-sigma factor FlgM